MHLSGASAVFLAVIISLSGAAKLPGFYLTPTPIGPELVLHDELQQDREAIPNPDTHQDLFVGNQHNESVSSTESATEIFNSILIGPPVTTVSTCSSSPATELVTDTILNTMTFYNTHFLTNIFETTNLMVNTVFTTLTTTKTVDDEMYITHRMTDYATITATETEIHTIPARTFYQTLTNIQTSTNVIAETTTVTDVHRMRHIDYVTRTSLTTNIVQSTVPVVKTDFVTIKPITSTVTNVAIVSVTETDIVAPFTALEYLTEVLTSTLVRDEWVAPQTSTIIQTVLYPEFQYRTSTEYSTSITTSYLKNQRFVTSTGLVLLSSTYYQKNTNTHIEDSTITRTTTITREIPQIIYSDIVSTTVVPRYDVFTIDHHVTKTNTFTETIEETITSILPNVQVIHSTILYTLEPSTFVNTRVVTPTCSDEVSAFGSAATLEVHAVIRTDVVSTIHSTGSSAIYSATVSPSATAVLYDYGVPLVGFK